jgi:hypothetical protein
MRPEGLAHLGLATVFVAWRSRAAAAIAATTRAGGAGSRSSGIRTASALRFALLGAALLVPLFAWRLAYYHDWVPNSVHAKSAARPYLSQGLIYVGLYFQYYAVLAIGALAGLGVAMRARRVVAGSDATAPALVLAFAHAALVVATTAWVGGDFMFARFLLPATPFLCLLCEAAALAAGRAAPAVALVLAAGVAGGGLWRQRSLHGRNVALHGIADERSQYSADLLATRARQGEVLRRCVAGTNATFLIQGAQASYAYYGRLPVAIEAYGLTDRTLARLPLAARGRPGHERRPPFEYLAARRTNFLLHLPGARPRNEFAQIDFGDLRGEILIYDRQLMERLRSCDDVRFTDFPSYFDAWLARAPQQDPAARQRDADIFRGYYFGANDDPQRLAGLEAALRR